MTKVTNSAHQKVLDLIQENQKSKVAKLQKKFQETHTIVGLQPCMRGTGKYDENGRHILAPVLRQNPETKAMEHVKVPIFHFTGWDYNNRYSGAKLREIRNKRVEQLIKDNPELKSVEEQIIDSNSWNG